MVLGLAVSTAQGAVLTLAALGRLRTDPLGFDGGRETTLNIGGTVPGLWSFTG